MSIIIEIYLFRAPVRVHNGSGPARYIYELALPKPRSIGAIHSSCWSSYVELRNPIKLPCFFFKKGYKYCVRCDSYLQLKLGPNVFNLVLISYVMFSYIYHKDD
jgi:hypothetical protein